MNLFPNNITGIGAFDIICEYITSRTGEVLGAFYDCDVFYTSGDSILTDISWYFFHKG